MLALFRIVEAAGGAILIDGRDISKIGLELLRKSIAIVPQEPVLFFGTVRSNLDPFAESTDDEIISSLKQVRLYERIFSGSGSSPSGLFTAVAFGGANFSVGERQLLCLARAILRRAQILVLDECSASIDLATDKLLQETIREAFKSATVLAIAHRIETIIGFDNVMVLKEGRMVEFGRPAELRAKEGGEFAALCERANIPMTS